jgi:hypothetical protein
MSISVTIQEKYRFFLALYEFQGNLFAWLYDGELRPKEVLSYPAIKGEGTVNAGIQSFP